MGEELKKLVEKALALEPEQIIGSGILTESMEILAKTDASELLKVLPEFLEQTPKIIKKVEPALDKIDPGELTKQVTAFMPKYMPVMREKISALDVSEIEKLLPKFAEYMPKIMPVMVKFMNRAIDADEAIKKELESLGDISMNFKDGVPTNIQIKGGKLLVSTELDENADLTVEMPLDISLGMMTGTADPMGAYMSGDIKMIGDMSKAMMLMPLREIFAEKFGIELM